ncbi:MAG: NADH-quinone oxidoreductase subunit H [Sedimentisphaerales bacterium]|nr:NADH-quinone oxidoreductase subunit H [Sedimentisphaerales bacterium]
MNLAWAIPVFAGATTGTVLLGLASKWIDRKVTARLQWRVGPPWYQPLADVLKLLGKETIMPETARGTGFLLMPLVGFAAVAVAAAICWQAIFTVDAGFVGDVIVVLYLLTIPSLMLVLGGSSSGNPLGAVGAAREAKLLLAYELPLLIAIVAAILGANASFQLGTLCRAPTEGVLPTIGCVLGFLVAVFCVQAKLGLVPFDVAEAECEIASGVMIEYSGPPLAMIYLTRAMLTAVLPLFVLMIFWNGMSFATVPAALASIGKYVLVLVLLILIRNTNPRLRIDHALKFFWFGMTPLAIGALVLSMWR